MFAPLPYLKHAVGLSGGPLRYLIYVKGPGPIMRQPMNQFGGSRSVTATSRQGLILEITGLQSACHAAGRLSSFEEIRYIYHEGAAGYFAFPGLVHTCFRYHVPFYPRDYSRIHSFPLYPSSIAG